MSGRSACDLALQDNREGPDDPQILVFGLSAMPDQGAVYDWRLPAHRTLGARGGTGGDAVSSGKDARGVAHPPADRGACVRYAEVLDGIHALPDEAITQRAHRDEFARAGLQLETSNADLRGGTPDAGDQGVKALFGHDTRTLRPSAAEETSTFPHGLDP